MKSFKKDFFLRLTQSFPGSSQSAATGTAGPGLLRGVVRATRRRLQLTPMKRVLNELAKRGVPLEELNTLEVFGCSGDGHVKDYVSLVASLEIWEIDPQFEKTLRSHFPNATIKITDSYQEIRRTSRKYDFVIVDNGTSTRPGGYCEHFDLFPDIFRVAKASCILIVNVIPEIGEEDSRNYPYLFNEEQLARRRLFYDTNHPEKITFGQMIEVYEDLCKTAGFRLDWHFLERRNFLYYLVLHLTRLPASDNNHSGS